MFGLSNPLNAMQILFINILMDGMFTSVRFDNPFIHLMIFTHNLRQVPRANPLASIRSITP